MPAHRALRFAATAVISLAVQTAPALAASFTYTPLSIDPKKGDLQPFVVGVYNDTAIGWGGDGSGQYFTYVWANGTYTLVPSLPVAYAVSDNGLVAGPGLSAFTYAIYDITTETATTYSYAPTGESTVQFSGINADGTVIATALTYQGKHHETAICQPFVQRLDGSFSWLADAKAGGYDGKILNDNNVAALVKCGAGNGVFLEKSGKIRKLTVPGGSNVYLTFLNKNGKVGGQYLDSSGKGFGFVSDAGKVTTYDFPGAAFTVVEGIGPAGAVAGFFQDATGYLHGFVNAGGMYHQIDYPRAKNTEIRAISATGAIVGYYGNLPPHGSQPTDNFIGTCADTKECTQ